jgi:hypothetical protein
MSRELFRLVGVWSGCWVVRDAPVRHTIYTRRTILCSPKATSSDGISDGMIKKCFLTFFNCIIRFQTKLLTNKLTN